MLRIAIPLALAELGWMGMSVVDNIMVGRLPNSAEAIGAASVGSALFYSFTIFGLGLMSGMDALVSHAHGADDWPGARRVLAAGIGLSCCAAPILTACVLASGPLLAVIGVQQKIASEALGFNRILVWSLPLLFAYTTFRRYLQGVHYVRPVTIALVTSNLINVAGNWVLIYGHLGFPALGVRGSALSTVIARAYLAGMLGWAVRRRDPGAFQDLRPDGRRIRALLSLGLPAALTVGFEVGVFNVVTALAGTLDEVSLAAHTIALNAAAVAYMVPLGIASAAAVAVGRARGQGNFRAAARAGWIAVAVGVVYECVSAVVFLTLAGPIARKYTTDARVIAFAGTLFLIAAVFQVFDGIQCIAIGALRGAGNTRTPMVWNLLGYWGLGLPLGCFLCYRLQWGVIGLWDGLCLALMLTATGLLETWKRQRLGPLYA